MFPSQVRTCLLLKCACLLLILTAPCGCLCVPCSTVAALYQEASRAGRDGQPAEHVLFTAPADVLDLIEWTHGDYSSSAAGQEYAWGHCLDLVEFLLEETMCRHQQLERNLGGSDASTSSCCALDGESICDNCRRRQQIQMAPLESKTFHVYDWASALIRAVDVCAAPTYGGAASLRGLTSHWMRAADGPVPKWTRVPLLLYALRYRALAVRFMECTRAHLTDSDLHGAETSEVARRRWRTLVVVDRALLFSSQRPPALTTIVLHRDRWDSALWDTDRWDAVAQEIADELEFQDGDDEQDGASEAGLDGVWVGRLRSRNYA